MSRRAMQSDVGEFIAARSDRLLRTAYLLTGDRTEAEELLQQALSRVWSTWARSELGPDLAAIRELARGMRPWWRRRRPREHPDEVLAALDRLPRGERAALVLTEVDRLSERELADVLECAEPTARRLRARARAAFAGEDPGALLAAVEVGDVPADSPVTTLAQRLGRVEHRVGVRRRWHRVELIASLVLATIAGIAIGVVVAPGDDNQGTLPAPLPPALKPPPVVVDHQLPPILHVNGVNYEYAYSVVSSAGESRLRLAVRFKQRSGAITWVTPWTLKGDVDVRVDGQQVYHGGPGPVGDGAALLPHERHIVVLTVNRALPGTHVALAAYHWPTR